MKRIFRTYGTASFAASPLGSRLGTAIVANCAILRVRLEDDDDVSTSAGTTQTPPHVAHAEFLFGTGFASAVDGKIRAGSA